MSNWHQNTRNEDSKNETPPYSRLFIVCGKETQESDLRVPFERYGEVETIHMPRDRNSGDSKGVAYIKFKKTSSAAMAIKELHQKPVKESGKKLKVMIAVNKNEHSDDINEEKLRRLFIKVPKQISDAEIKQIFSELGQVESVHVQKDRATNESKGLAYVQFKTFVDASKAFEECDTKYKAVFATPRLELKRNRDNSESNDSYRPFNSNIRRDYDFYPPPRNDMHMRMPMPRENMPPMLRATPQNYNTVLVTCSPEVPQRHLERLFNIIPGMLQFRYSIDSYNGCCKATVTYENESNAAHAVERINNLQFPSGELVCVKLDNPLSKAASELTTIVNSFKNAVDAGAPDLMQLADAIAQASTLIKVATSTSSGKGELKPDQQDSNYCSVVLPPPQPMADTNRLAQRCFIVCKPQPPPLNILKDVFCRFGDLIDVSTIPRKTFGFAKFASIRAAQEAISTLHGAVVCGVKLKVLEADERQSNEDKMNVDTDQSEYTDRKRMRLDDDDEDGMN